MKEENNEETSTTDMKWQGQKKKEKKWTEN